MRQVDELQPMSLPAPELRKPVTGGGTRYVDQGITIKRGSGPRRAHGTGSLDGIGSKASKVRQASDARAPKVRLGPNKNMAPDTC